MTFLLPTEITGRVVWLGRVLDRATSLVATEVYALDLTLEGIVGEHHSGLTRRSCTRVKRQYPVGTDIRNTRQISLVSREELDAIASDMGVDTLNPAWFGANIAIEGVDMMTRLPPGSRLIFEGGASITVDTENTPCKVLAAHLETRYPGQGLSVPKHATGRRGLVGWVERTGRIANGEGLRLHVPKIHGYPPIERSDSAKP